MRARSLQAPWEIGRGVLVEEVDGVDQLAVDVELELVGGAVSDPHGRRAPVALEVVEHLLGELGAAVDGVHDLERARLVTDALAETVGQPVHEAGGLVGEAEPEQRVEGEGRVADPRVAVVPVAAAADLLRQARRRRGDHRPGRLVREQLEHERGAVHGLPPAPAVARMREPAAPELDRVLELLPRLFRRDRCGTSPSATVSSTNDSLSPGASANSPRTPSHPHGSSIPEESASVSDGGAEDGHRARGRRVSCASRP